MSFEFCSSCLQSPDFILLSVPWPTTNTIEHKSYKTTNFSHFQNLSAAQAQINFLTCKELEIWTLLYFITDTFLQTLANSEYGFFQASEYQVFCLQRFGYELSLSFSTFSNIIRSELELFFNIQFIAWVVVKAQTKIQNVLNLSMHKMLSIVKVPQKVNIFPSLSVWICCGGWRSSF